ncbi:hypothetical protein [Planctellipticum variicoloris]|uniref:hypothetical protein n=1 Tax=Planctellipticum variicoloris TaxID=3064265 RepID=UPI0030135022|nr:hypothetical protein SH412_000768 [Planctomycetaceae bacterium SH412]
MEQGFPPVDTESANWIVLILLVLVCAGYAIQWRWKLRKVRPFLLSFWSLVLIVAWIGDGGFQTAEYVPRWAPTLTRIIHGAPMQRPPAA